MTGGHFLLIVSIVLLLGARTDCSSFSSSSSDYYLAEPVTLASGENRSNTVVLADATKNALHFFADVPNNAAQLLVEITPQRAADHPTSTLNVLLRRGAPAPLSSPPSASDVTTCNASQSAVTSYRCVGLTIDVQPSSSPSSSRIFMAQPKGGRYFLSFTASRGVVDFAWRLTWTTCPNNAAPDATGQCYPVQALPQGVPVHLDASANQYYYVLPPAQSSTGLVALAINYSTIDTSLCGNGNMAPRVYMREAGMANPTLAPTAALAQDGYDVSLPCATSTSDEPFVQWWLAPGSSQVFFLAVNGGRNGFDFQISTQFVTSTAQCGGRLTGVRCATALVGQTTCPAADVASCFAGATALSNAKSQSASVHFSAVQTWSVVSVRVDNDIFALDLVVRANADQLAQIKRGESWQLVAHYETAPSADTSNVSTAVRYPLSAATTIGTLTAATPILTLSVPYPKTGTWYLALQRQPATPGFGEDPQLLPVSVVVAVAQTDCPGSCSGRGTCNAQSHKCTCKFGYTGVDCSALVNANDGDTKDGLVLGLAVTIPVLAILVAAAAAYIWWRETIRSNYELA